MPEPKPGNCRCPVNMSFSASYHADTVDRVAHFHTAFFPISHNAHPPDSSTPELSDQHEAHNASSHAQPCRLGGCAAVDRNRIQVACEHRTAAERVAPRIRRGYGVTVRDQTMRLPSDIITQRVALHAASFDNRLQATSAMRWS